MHSSSPSSPTPPLKPAHLSARVFSTLSLQRRAALRVRTALAQSSSLGQAPGSPSKDDNDRPMRFCLPTMSPGSLVPRELDSTVGTSIPSYTDAQVNESKAEGSSSTYHALGQSHTMLIHPTTETSSPQPWPLASSSLALGQRRPSLRERLFESVETQPAFFQEASSESRSEQGDQGWVLYDFEGIETFEL